MSSTGTGRPTALQSHGVIETQPLEVYGHGAPILRIGNGGAGATGLIAALATDYLDRTDIHGSIAWICNHSRNTQLALLHGDIDVALTYERDQEALAAHEGWSVTAGCVFHDHFCLVGPLTDPADVKAAASVDEAFAAIAAKGALFHSRADGSATMWKERAVWTAAGLAPWDDAAAAQSWYRTSLLSPAAAIVSAVAAGAYLLTDRSTLLRQTSLRTLERCTVFFEPRDEEDVLMNSCFVLYSPNSVTRTPAVAVEVERFLQYAMGHEGQAVIAEFGKRTVGVPFFAPVVDGFARDGLVGGYPQDGTWKM